MKPIKLFILTFLILTFSSLTHARLVQIIHTNDLHSYFTGYYNGTGGYARVLTKIKEIRSDAASKGIEVLQVDGGDWGEGTSFFHSNNGSDSVKALEMLGTDVATVGNHDHMMGGNMLGRQIRAANVTTKFVAANLVQTPDMDIKNIVTPFVDVERAGIPIRVIGLTTAESFFQYSISPGKISSPTPVGEAEGKKAKAAGKELVIALTHIGLTQDKSLAKNSSSIDVIVGGHSHTKLSGVNMVRNKVGKNVPIVQAWSHGLAVGSLLLDVKEGGGVEVVDYKLHEVGAPLAADPLMTAFVERSISRRNGNFNYDWNEVIGETETPITGYVRGNPIYRKSCWGRHMATAARQAAGAQVGIHLASFEGVFKPAGPITFGDIAESYPHFRKYGDHGWEIATVFMSGWKLRPLMSWISNRGYGVTFSGLGHKTMPDKSKVLMVNDEEVDEKATYRIAFPAEVALAINTSFPGFRGYLQGLKFTGKYYWPVMYDYIKKNSPLRCN